MENRLRIDPGSDNNMLFLHFNLLHNRAFDSQLTQQTKLALFELSAVPYNNTSLPHRHQGRSH